MLPSSSKVRDPHPGQPYRGGKFCAFLPDNREGQRTAMLLKKAFEHGLTFQIKSCDGEDRVTWGLIPHKTAWDGGKARYGPAPTELPGVGGFFAIGEPWVPAQQILAWATLPGSLNGSLGAILCFSSQGRCGVAPSSPCLSHTPVFPMDKDSRPVHVQLSQPFPGQGSVGSARCRLCLGAAGAPREQEFHPHPS